VPYANASSFNKVNRVFALPAVLMTPLALTCPLIAPRSEGKGIDELEREYY
jgi:hypothetical protein